MDLGLSERVFIATGASRGLGFATAQCLVADGARVVISARDKSRVDAAVERLGDTSRAVGVVADLGDPLTPQRLVDRARDHFGRLDGALISVGGPPRATPMSATDEQWQETFETVFMGTVRMARTVGDALDSGGAIALVLSSSARSPIPGLALSNALRPGLAGFAKDLADELAPRNIRVISLLPHRILTDRNRELFAATGDAEQARAEVEASIPLGRLGDPAEFGRVAAFMLSPAAGYLTGLSIPVDGGAVRSI